MPDPFCRVTVVGSRRRADIALPERVPLAELVGDLVAFVAEPAGGSASRSGRSWALARLGQDSFPLEETLAELGVVDGEVLYLQDEQGAEAPATVEELVEAVQELVDADPFRWRPAFTQRLLLSVAVLVSAATSGYALGTGPGDRALGATLSALSVGLMALAAWVERMAGRRDTTRAVAATAAPFAAAGTVLLLSGGFGPPMIASAAAGLLVWVAMAFGATPSAWPLAWGSVASAMIMLFAGLVTWAGPAVATAGVIAVGELLVIGLLPRPAASVSGLARLDDRSVGGPLPAGQVAETMWHADGVLTCSLVAIGAVSLPCLIALSMFSSAWSRSLAALVGTGLLLRARTFSSARHALPLLLAGIGGLLTTAGFVMAGVVGTPPPWWVPVLIAVVVAGLVLAATLELPAPAAARSRQVLDLVERVLVAVALPVLAGHLGLYAEVVERFS